MDIGKVNNQKFVGAVVDESAAIGIAAVGAPVVAATVTVANVALGGTGHRTMGTYAAQGEHRTPSEWIQQGNHRTPGQWLSGEESKNRK